MINPATAIKRAKRKRQSIKSRPAMTKAGGSPNRVQHRKKEFNGSVRQELKYRTSPPYGTQSSKAKPVFKNNKAGMRNQEVDQNLRIIRYLIFAAGNIAATKTVPVRYGLY